MICVLATCKSQSLRQCASQQLMDQLIIFTN